MALVLSHATALWVLSSLASRGVRLQPVPGELSGDLESPECLPPRVVMALWHAAVEPLLHLRYGQCEVHCLVPQSSHRGRRGFLLRHGSCADLPREFMVQLGDGVCACRPELCFLQMATELDMVELSLLGMALCGRYYPADNDAGFVQTQPLTSVAAMRRFLTLFREWRMSMGRACPSGFERARRAVELICDNAYSPLESATVLFMTLPRSLGGYGLASPRLNVPVRLSREAARVFGRPVIRPDILYAEARVVIECLGRPYHMHPERDVRRELALRHDGYTVLFLTYEQLCDELQRDELMGAIVRATGRKSRSACADGDVRRRGLLGKLLPKADGLREDGSLHYAKPAWALPAVACLQRLDSAEAIAL